MIFLCKTIKCKAIAMLNLSKDLPHVVKLHWRKKFPLAPRVKTVASIYPLLT